MSKKSVTFALMSQLAFIAYPTESERTKLFYTSKEREIFKHISTYERAMCSEMVSRKLKHEERLTRDEMISCLGIESFIFSGAAKHFARVKKEHVRAILAEQARQNRLGVYDAVEFARVSITHSRASMARAHKIALVVMHLDD